MLRGIGELVVGDEVGEDGAFPPEITRFNRVPFLDFALYDAFEPLHMNAGSKFRSCFSEIRQWRRQNTGGPTPYVNGAFSGLYIEIYTQRNHKDIPFRGSAG